MADDDLLRFLTTLCLGKSRLLVKIPDSKHIGQQDRFRFNQDFKSPMTRIKVGRPASGGGLWWWQREDLAGHPLLGA